MDNSNRESYIYVYESVGGWKSQLCTWDEEFQMVMPYVAGMFGYATELEANKDAERWAFEENCTAYLSGSDGRNYSIKYGLDTMEEFTLKVMGGE